ncbi:hypothetical protein M1437_01255 [Patescibacteria group bacterium]|nr:hypothetical protein [Patescibacteria group bacterium]
MAKEQFSPRVAIAAGFGMEVYSLRELIKGTLQEPVKGDINLYKGRVEDMDVILFVSGMGMNRARRSTEEVLKNYPSIKFVIDTGTAGSISTAQPPTIIIPDRWEDYSWVIGQNIMEKRLFGRDDYQDINQPVEVNKYLLEMAKSVTPEVGVSVIGGVGLCSSKVLIRGKHKVLLQEHYPQADIVDMESYAVIQACQEHDRPTPAIAIRAVSDMAGKGYRAFLRNFTSAANRANFQDAIQNYTMFVGALIRKLT